MYRVYKVSAGAIARGELKDFNPVTNSHGYEGYAAQMIAQDDLPYGTPAQNARPFGPKLDQKLAPPVFEIAFSGNQAVEMRIGPDALHPFTTSVPVTDVHMAQSMAEGRIDTLRQVNYMLDRSTMNELEKIDMSAPEHCLSFLLGCHSEPAMSDRTFADDVMSMAAVTLGETVSAYAMQQFYASFALPYYKEFNKGEGEPAEKAGRAVQIACVALHGAAMGAYDKTAIREFAQEAQQKIDKMWDARNEGFWDAWSNTDIAAAVPAKFSAVFKSTFINDMNIDLNGCNWGGDMALIYTSAYDAAYRAHEAATSAGEMDVAQQYFLIQQSCANALDALREESEKNVPPVDHERERGYQPYNQEEPSDEDPQHSTEDEEWEMNGPGGI